MTKAGSTCGGGSLRPESANAFGRRTASMPSTPRKPPKPRSTASRTWMHQADQPRVMSVRPIRKVPIDQAGQVGLRKGSG